MISQTEKMINIPSEAADMLFQHAQNGILITDATGIITKANAAAEKMFGYATDELAGTEIQSLVANQNNLKSDLQTGKRKDGSEFPVEIKYSLLSSQNYILTIAFITDLSFINKSEYIIHQQRSEIQRLRAEEKELNVELEKRVRARTRLLEETLMQLESNREELKHSLEKEEELNEIKSRFISMASHEFRTPLATILSSTNLAAKYGKEGDYYKQEKHINRIKSSITHMTELMNDILSVSKVEEGIISIEPEVIDLPAFINTLIVDIKPLLKNGQLILFIHKGEKRMFTDKKILKNLLFNLLTNAIKFSNENQPIAIKTEIRENEICVSVKDEGIGIAEEDQKQLFRRFFRGENAVNIQGTGLGLYITVKYAELLGGRISFNSK